MKESTPFLQLIPKISERLAGTILILIIINVFKSNQVLESLALVLLFNMLKQVDFEVKHLIQYLQSSSEFCKSEIPDQLLVDNLLLGFDAVAVTPLEHSLQILDFGHLHFIIFNCVKIIKQIRNCILSLFDAIYIGKWS